MVKKATGTKKVGHAGTLDPMATGALVLAIGKVTRLIRYIQDQAKEYVATAVFGVATDTLDADGAVLSREPMDIGRGRRRRDRPPFHRDHLPGPTDGLRPQARGAPSLRVGPRGRGGRA